MRVMQLVHSLRRGGAERVLLDLSLGLTSIGHDVCVASLLDRNEYRERRYERLSIRSLIRHDEYRWPWAIPRLAAALHRQVDAFRPDVIEVHTPTAAIVAACAGIHTSVVQVFHGYGDIMRPPSFKAFTRRSLDRWTFRRLKSRVIVVSPAMKAAVSKHLALAEGDVDCIQNGIDLKKFKFREAQPSHEPIVYVVGTLSPMKRVDRSIHALHALKRTFPGAMLRILGQGPARAELEGLILSLGLLDSVKLMGMRVDIPELLIQGDLLWHLSESEGLPLAVLEAMAAGLPVIGTNVRGINDVVVEGETGFLVSDGDDSFSVAARSIELLSAPDKHQIFARASRRRAEQNYSLSRMVEQHELALKQTILRR